MTWHYLPSKVGVVVGLLLILTAGLALTLLLVEYLPRLLNATIGAMVAATDTSPVEQVLLVVGMGACGFVLAFVSVWGEPA